MKQRVTIRYTAALLLFMFLVFAVSCRRTEQPGAPAAVPPPIEQAPSAASAAPPSPPPSPEPSTPPVPEPGIQPEGFSSMELREGSLFFHSGEWLEALRIFKGPDQEGSADITVQLLGGPGGVAYTIDGQNKYSALESAFLADLDGDGQSELILMFATHGTGGMGTHGLQVLQYNGKEILSIPLPGGDEYTHMGDVTITPLPQYMARLENHRTGYEATVLLPEWEDPDNPYPRCELYNGDGSLRESARSEHVDCVYEIGFTPYDGAWALTTRQYVWLTTHVNGIGDWVSSNILQDGQWVCLQEGPEWYEQP